MSIFSHIRKSRQQAKEHNAKLAEQKKQQDKTTARYKHIPTHAASDAISSAPPAWREAADRPRIVEQNRRRSAMAAAGLSMNMPSTTTITTMPRVSSSLSHVSYPNGAASPQVMSRAHSYNSIHPYGSSRDVVYSLPDATLSQPLPWKGKETGRNFFYDVSGGSSTLVSKDPSPEGSSRASNSSHDELEMVTVPSGRPKAAQTLQVPQVQLQQAHSSQAQIPKIQQLQQAQQRQHQPALQSQPAPPTQPMQPVQDVPRPESSSAHRLHPSRRRNSLDHTDRAALPKSSSRDSRPPTSMRGFNYIPSSANQQQPVVASLPGKLSQSESNNVVSPSYSHQPSGMGYSGFSPTSPTAPAAAPPAARTSSDFNLDDFSIPSPGLDFSGGYATQPSTGQTQCRAQTKEHAAPKKQQQPEMEPIVSGYSRHASAQIPPPVAHDSLVNMFPEPAPQSYVDGKSGRGKLSKGKKNRWSFMKSSPATA